MLTEQTVYMSANVTSLSLGGVPYRHANINCTEGWIAWEPVHMLNLDEPGYESLKKIWDNPEDDAAFADA